MMNQITSPAPLSPDALPPLGPTQFLRRRDPVVAIVGATGAVGAELIACLERRGFAHSGLRLLASARSAGKTVPAAGQAVEVQELTEAAFEGVDLALFSAGAARSRQFAPAAVRAGAIVVDNSSAFRMDPGVPLVVPEINAAALALHSGIIANPNCAAIIAGLAMYPLHRADPITRAVVTTYQAASGGGAAMMEELLAGTRAYLAGEAFTPRVLSVDYAFNLFSHNTAVDPETLYNDEETKLAQETRKIFGAPELPIAATCIRVPVLRAHSIALNLSFARPLSPEAARALLNAAPGVRVVDDAAANHFPTPREASGRDEVLVGRIRTDRSDPSGRSLAMFVAGDQLLKGAALNTVQIAEALLK
jgi:aspartate-semialdehyde dehydrogenase